MRTILAAALLAGAFASVLPAGAARAEETPQQRLERQLREAERLFRDGADRLAQSAETLLRAVPQYEMPQFTENGDIIIRRKRTPPAPPPAPGRTPLLDPLGSTAI